MSEMTVPGWPATHPARAIVDLAAIRHNVRTLGAAAPSSAVMAVVKADAYGHGLLPVATAALQAGATWLGVAQVAEALPLRAGLDATGVRPPILAWLFAPGADLAPAVAADIDLSASAPWAIEEIAAAARATGRTARVHLKVDTGMSRGGARPEAFGDLLDAAARARADGTIEVAGIWSHLACADEPDSPVTAQQVEVFTAALDQAGRAGIRPEVRHIAQSAGTLFHPAAHFDLVRPGIATYGLTPAPAVASSADLDLRPAMRVEARLTVVKTAPPGTGISYGHRARTTAETTLAVVPLGYADGLPRTASDAGPVSIAGRKLHVAGRICMDQMVVDVGPGSGVREGDLAVVFGAGDDGGPTADEWAEAAGTISYEIVSGIGARVPRVHVDTARPGREAAEA
ncbi:alanine racemase [Georgenia alba]|uniref:Alanine racemase n=1 Tax=Georgenia alba TaxID=2233858 RepID=A0ABW2QAN6_9MICO